MHLCTRAHVCTCLCWGAGGRGRVRGVAAAAIKVRLGSLYIREDGCLHAQLAHERNRPPIMRNMNKRLEMCIPQGKHCWSSGLNCRNFESTPGVMRCMPTSSRAPSVAETCVCWCSSTSAGWLLPRGAGVPFRNTWFQILLQYQASRRRLRRVPAHAGYPSSHLGGMD